MRKVMTAVFGILLAAAPAFAQDKPVDVNIGFGATWPTSDIKNDFNVGWNGTIGVTINANPKLGFLVDYTYHHMNGPEKTILVSPGPVGVGSPQLIQSNHQMHVGTFDVVYKMQNHDTGLGGYVLAGPGVYHRIVQLTSPAVGYTTVCDPYWYVCYPAAVSVDNILGDRSSTDMGINFGGGITFGHEAKFYIEMRYAYVFGKTITPNVSTTACPNGCSTSASYIPLTFGVRW